MRKTERYAGHSYKGKRSKGVRFGTLWADYDSAEGEVTITFEFANQDSLMKADILNDVIGLLTREYEDAMQKFWGEIGEKR